MLEPNTATLEVQLSKIVDESHFNPNNDRVNRNRAERPEKVTPARHLRKYREKSVKLGQKKKLAVNNWVNATSTRSFALRKRSLLVVRSVSGARLEIPEKPPTALVANHRPRSAFDAEGEISIFRPVSIGTNGARQWHRILMND